MSGTGTGIAPGFGGFAATPDGQLTYLNRRFNPYAFLQQDQMGGLAATAPAAADQGLARGGWVQRLEDGGDAGGSDGNDGSSGADGDDGGEGVGQGGNNAMGIGDDGNAIGLDAAGNAAGSMGGMTSAGQPSALGMPGFAPSMEEDPTAAQMGVAAAKGALGGLAPGVGMALGLGANALGMSAMGPGATMGSGIMGALGGMMGGPMGAAAGAAVGAMAGAHGTSGPGMGGTGSSAGPGGSQGNGADAPPNSPDSTDITSIMNRIRAAMNTGVHTGVVGQPYGDLSSDSHGTALARGGRAVNGHGDNHFHGGSGLVHSASDGRADAVQTSVPHGSYVVPADVVSGLGQGNTMAGAKKLGGMLGPATHFASGGSVPVKLSGGEFVLHPAHVAALGGGDMKAGSDKLDQMVGHVRRISAAQVDRMPPPR